MAKRSRAKARPPEGAQSCPPASEPRAPVADFAGSTSQLKGWRLWAFRLASMLLVPALILVVAETALRISGYGYSTHFFLKTPDGQYLVNNPKYCFQYYDSHIATHPHATLMHPGKPAGGMRIFVLGESAAEGTPDPAFGFARILEVMLRDRYPGKNIEVVNAAVRGINSHIILPIARECAQWEPDLFIVYMGNNEIIGLYSPEPGHFNLAAWPNLIRVRQWVKQTRMAQLLVSITERTSSVNKNMDMEYFRRQRLATDDPLRQPVYDNFQRNLNEICDVVERSKAKMLLATVGVNLLDCPPLASLHRKGLSDSDMAAWEALYKKGIAAESEGKYEEAIRQYQEAARTDDHFADLHFRLARSLLAAHQLDRAREEFTLARNWDALQFRSDARINETIRKTWASRTSGTITPCDVERALETNVLSVQGIPGEKLFIDQVHFTFEGDYALASALLPGTEKSLGLGESTRPVLTQQECALRLGFTSWDQYNVAEAGIRATANPPFTDQIDHAARQKSAEQAVGNRLETVHRQDLGEMIAVYQKALSLRPDDWQLHLHFGDLFIDMKNLRAAVAEFEILVKLFPYSAPYRIKLAQAQAEIGKRAEAVANIKEAARLDPNHPAIKDALAWAKSVSK